MSEEADKRIAWVEARTQSCFKHIKPDKFRKAFRNDETRRVVLKFLESDSQCLIFSGDVTASDVLPKRGGKTKSLYFLKTKGANVTETGIEHEVLVSEMSNSPLEHLESIVQEIYLPLLSNPRNQRGWGEVASKEIMDRLHSLLANVSITVGHTKGQTRLPLPFTDTSPTAATTGKDKDKIHLLEGAVITWTKQIKNILKKDPEGLLKQGLHPTPDQEIDFWKSKAANLNSIWEQLQSDRIRKVLKYLEQSKSTYCVPFHKLCKEVFSARIEANDNVKYLRTLENWFYKLNNSDDFPSLIELFKPMMHIVLMIWKNSKYYNTPGRLVVLMRETCNALINQACRYLSGEQIFSLIENEEAGQAVDQLKTTLRVCGSYKTTYFDYKTTANAECPHNPWRIQNNALFMRLDSFLERCHDILDLTQTIVQFSKLAKIEIGGTKGKTLTTSVQQIYTDFQGAVSSFQNVPYDIMDVSAKQFDDDFYEFRCRIKELERRLGSVLTQGFDDCATIYGRFKLLDSFEGLLERPIIQDELEKKHIALVQSYGQDLKTVQELFLSYRDTPPISWNLPPIAGALSWCRGLKERIEDPMRKLQQLNRSIMEREEAKEVCKVYNTIIMSLEEFEDTKIGLWSRSVEQSSQAKLKLPLLVRDKATRLLQVNFDPELVKLLREVKYFLLLNLEVPDTAVAIYRKAETYRRQTGNFDLLVNMYNEMMTSLLPVEAPLMKSQLQKIDKIIAAGIREMNWKSHSIDSFISQCQSCIRSAHDVLFELKENLKQIDTILQGWSKQPLLDRGSKPVSHEEFATAHKSLRIQRYNEIKDGGSDIHKKLKKSNAVLKISKGHPDWRAYVDYANGIVIDGLVNVAKNSLEYLEGEVNPVLIKKNDKLPVLEIDLDLYGKGVIFMPDIFETAHGTGIRDIVNDWIQSFFHVALLMKRLDDSEGTYLREISEHLFVRYLLNRIDEHLSENEDKCIEFLKQYQEYSYLWTTDLQSVFEKFVQDATVELPSGARVPDLDKYDAEITKYREIQMAVSELKTPTDIGWLRVNSQPIKQALSTWVTKWVYMFTQSLQDHITNRLTTLHHFMDRVETGLSTDIEAGNKKILMDCMGYIRDVRKAMDETQEVFAPLRDAVALLKKHGISMEGIDIDKTDCLEYLEQAPLKFEATINATFKKKEEILPFQNAELEHIKEEIEEFFLKMRKFRDTFRKTAPFSFEGSATEAYEMIDDFFAQLTSIEVESKKLNELEELFELPVSRYQETVDTRSELQLLKKLWDFKSMIQFRFDDWQSLLWSSIDTDALEDATKKILKEVREMGRHDQIIKGWQIYRDIENMVKNMSIVLPLVNQLHSPAMRDRHWKSLAVVCHAKSLDPRDPRFCLEHLLALELHKHEEDVEEIVETAVKELKIEKKLQAIEEVWTSLALDYIPHKDTDVRIVKVSDEVMEFLETHQLELQGMIGMGKFVEYFRDRVTLWQKNLGNVEGVIKEWLSVTRAWASLESIFLASQDIRTQLPDDTKRFEGIDQEFRDLMGEAITQANVVEACTAEGREDVLKGMSGNLELCQKSLNEYLDMKKKIFPRFYFVSNVALLDILSNGNNPPKIMPYAGDCYDSIATLTFREPADPAKPANVAHRMIAKDGEIVDFFDDFVISGAVEDWLNDLTRKQQDTLRRVLDKAVESAVNWEVEKPRHLWLFDYPAQIVLVGTQIYWTEETEGALEEYENGQEDSVKRSLQVCNERLHNLIQLVLGKLSKADRTKIISLITMDVHGRDTVQKLIDQKAQGPLSFIWQQQLRFYWQQETKDVNIRITDFHTKYYYEWVGNSGRLVITPLTDRCYITLTMAMRLMRGGAPAGPAGTGKTETTKDLARALALPCYVFNCSDQMNYQTMADIFKGLAQSGSWGCFDEFNRIMIEVLSVVATQVKSCLDAIVKYAVPANREEQYQHLPPGQPPCVVGEFELMGDTIKLVPTVGFFITMNPGYAGRTELPENLKALFRSCAMIRPDLALICENMLMSEGFMKARPLSIKFVTLFMLCSDLLSKQVHYDWGLRAVKSVLCVAGSLKRAEPDVDEEAVLMRALRDFNTPKMPSMDTPIFLRLIQDLFPQYYQIPTKIDEDLKNRVNVVCKKRNLQSDKLFILKVTQFQELLDVRHSVMLLGPAGCGKTTIWKTLSACHNLDENHKPKAKPSAIYNVVNPKAVTSNELYGFMTLAKDWKDGCLSIIMRGMSRNNKELGYGEHQTYKWVLLDGDIDSVWIESMNTVMDDNKKLTLVSNERIPLSDAMRMVFEINSLANATPATVSRAGILFINDTDIGWRPYVESWVNERDNEQEKAHIPNLFDKYIDPLIDSMRKDFKNVIPLPLINKICTICHLLEGLLQDVQPEDLTSETIENLFVYALVWAFGGPLIIDKQVDHRKNFHGLLLTLFPNIKYPTAGGNKKGGNTEGGSDDNKLRDATCFDFFYDVKKKEFVHWSTKVQPYAPVPIGTGPAETQFMNLVVHTVDSVRMTHLLDLLVQNSHPVMFVGTAGNGKTTMMKDYLRNMDEDMLSTIINMNYFMDSAALQLQIEDAVEKRSGRVFGPPPNKNLVYFIDDLNLPYIETYGTQNSLELLRQLMDHKECYDRNDLGFRKEFTAVQYLAAMNPTAGSFTVNQRLQRHFATIACLMPDGSDLRLIYNSIISGHLQQFTGAVSSLADRLTNATISLHEQVSKYFLPSATKFVYNWNMRELSNVFQGLCLAKAEYYPQPLKVVRLWIHECARVFGDRLVNESDIGRFADLLVECSKRFFEEEQEALHERPIIFTSFATATSGEPAYLPLNSGEDGMKQLTQVLESKLLEYNESNSIMDLVLFEQAMEHICRITRIIWNPSGNAMLVGVGGSGKQSLSRLAAHICGYDVVQLQVTAKFTEADLKERLVEMYKNAGIKGNGMVFLLTDTQIVNEKFLVYVNDMLSSGWISDLFAKDELESVFSALRSEAQAAGVADTPDSMLEFFISRVRGNLHLVLCFSPVGELFRIRARRFPGLINCTAIDWFHAWPRDALVSVASRFLEDVEVNTAETKENIAHHMAEVHLAVTSESQRYKELLNRHNYVTPKSFLELINFYKHLLGLQRGEVAKQINRLDVGLSTLRKTAQDVAELQVDLKHNMVKVEEKKRATDALLEQMGKQRGEAEIQQAVATEEEEKANNASAIASKIESEAEVELASAKPAMIAAGEAVNCLNKASLTELKNFNKPPSGVDKVTACCLMMVEGEFRNHKWDRAKKMMAKVDQFIQKLKDFDAESMEEELVEKLGPFMDDPDFNVETMVKKSNAAANLCSWVCNIYKYNRIYVKVKPLMDSLEAARANKSEAEAQLAKVQAVVADVNARLKKLQETLLEATNEKMKVEAEAQACQARLGLAERLVNGLSSENERWGNEIEKLTENETTLIGDVLLASAFVSYAGCFDSQFRNDLWQNTWIPDLIQREIPLSEGVDPLSMLTNDAKNAQMMTDGLPADRISIENGSIISAAKRWPLIIDPQLQGIKWLRKKEENNNLHVIRLSQHNWIRTVEQCIQNGYSLIIENIDEDIDATLDPVLSRAVYKKGRNYFLRLGGEEVEYDQNFRLYLQTKLSNPHYKPEIQAQCTMINFIATEKGLEDQLLARVVNAEKPELEAQKQKLQDDFNSYKIQLLDLEDQLLERLANAPDDILSDVPLIEGLEATKAAAMEINAAVELGQQTEIAINKAREIYRPVAAEGAMLYFILTHLDVINHMYQYSLDAFILYFNKSIRIAEKSDDDLARIQHLCKCLRLTIYTWVSRGLFESDKLILQAQLTFELMRRGKIGDPDDFNQEYFDFLMRGPKKLGEDNPLAWLPLPAWNAVQALSDLEDFQRFPGDLVEASSRFREWFNHTTPEEEKLPLDWAQLDKKPFLKLLVLRCLRPDRLTIALSNFIRHTLPDGDSFVDCGSSLSAAKILDRSLDDSTPETPIYFILSPGTDVVSVVESAANSRGLEKGISYHNVSMGQGQDIVAMEKLENGHKQGHWVMLNNVHLMPRWLVTLEKKLDEFALEGSHKDFRIFLTSDPSKSIPIGILNRSVKLTNEPPTGLKANLKRAFCSFNAEQFDELEPKSRSILFALCVFHSVLIERKKFGPMGFNMMYPFGLGDLKDSAVCLNNYMENNTTGKIPWDDLRYIFGQIMYGGHIVNDFDRLLAVTYLDHYLRDELLDEMELFPFVGDEKGFSFKAPVSSGFNKYLEYIEKELNTDTPLAFGLHPNAEIGFRTDQSEQLFSTLKELQPRDAGGMEGGQSPQHVAENILNDILERFGEVRFDIGDIEATIEEKGPFQNVFIQECQTINKLLVEMSRSLQELNMGFAGELTISDSMEGLMDSLYLDRVPESWSKLAWESLRPLGSWLHNLQERLTQLQDWTTNPMEVPRITWISGLINPQSFLTAIMQQTAQRNNQELDKLIISTEVTKKKPGDIDSASRDGCYVTGLYLQGARWDVQNSMVTKSNPREMYCEMPVINCRAVGTDKLTETGQYFCPVYKTEQRGPTFVFRAQLKSKSPASRWIMAGVALIMELTG